MGLSNRANGFGLNGCLDGILLAMYSAACFVIVFQFMVAYRSAEPHACTRLILFLGKIRVVLSDSILINTRPRLTYSWLSSQLLITFSTPNVNQPDANDFIPVI